MSSLKPSEITANRQIGDLTIKWSDGHISIYPFSMLRFACPCAECRGGHESMGAEPDPEVFNLPLEDSLATRMRNLEAVGSYAIAVEWADGHHYGIYKWGYLRALCPCPICRGLGENHWEV